MGNIIESIIKFRDERDWKQFHNPKDLAISLVLEANELLENFQWKTSEEAINKNIDNIREELADVFIYSIMLANDLGMDIEEIISEKLKKNNLKYPVEKSKGSKNKYNEL